MTAPVPITPGAQLYLMRQNGCACDGVTLDDAALLALLTNVPTGSTIIGDGGTLLLGSQINIPQDNISIVDLGNTTLKAAPNTSFEYVILGTGRVGVKVGSFTIDANKNARANGQTVRFMGAGFIDSTACTFDQTKAINTRGYNGISAVGLTIAGVSKNCKLIAPLVENCGDAAPNQSDGIYTSGDHNRILGAAALNCTDTGVVIENSNYSIATGITAENCGAAAAITNASSLDCYGNQIHGVTAKNCLGGVTGQIQIGVPVQTTGNLIDTQISGINLVSTVSTGPAINVRRASGSAGQTVGLQMSQIMIDGSATQGVLIEAADFSLSDFNIKNTQNACVQVNGTGRDGRISDGKTAAASGSFGVYSYSNPNISLANIRNVGGNWAVYFDGVATGCSYENVRSTGHATGVVGNSPGNVPTAI